MRHLDWSEDKSLLCVVSLGAEGMLAIRPKVPAEIVFSKREGWKARNRLFLEAWRVFRSGGETYAKVVEVIFYKGTEVAFYLNRMTIAGEWREPRTNKLISNEEAERRATVAYTRPYPVQHISKAAFHYAQSAIWKAEGSA